MRFLPAFLLFVSCESVLIIPKDFPDPVVIIVGDLYHAFATNSYGVGAQNIQHATSLDLKNWTLHDDSLPQLGSWARTGLTWAPYVFRNGDQFIMWYTATEVKNGWQCIGVAKTDNINEPFVDDSDAPLVCPPGIGRIRAIDAYMYQEDGQRYILYASTLGVKDINIHKVNRNGNQLIGEATRLVHVDQEREQNVNEAPTLIKRGSTYFLFFSACGMGDERYFTTFATSENITGPYVKAEPIMTTEYFNRTVLGPGGEDVIMGKDGKEYIFYHGWDKDVKIRMLHVSHLEWNERGLPFVPLD